MDYHHLPSLTRLPQPWRTLLDSYFATAGDAYCVMLPDEATDAANGPLPADRFWGGEQIHWVNEAMTLLLGQSANQLVGLPAEDLFAHDPAVGQELWQKLGQNDVIRQEVRIFRGDGALISVDCECHTILFTEGERLGHILSLKNNPRQHYTVDNRLYLADAIKEAQHIAQIGSWEMSLTSNEMLWSDEIFRIMEVDKRAFAGTQEAFRALIPEEEIDVIRQKFWDCVERREPYEMIHRLRMSDGRIKYVHELAKVIYDRKGQPLRAIGTMQDITLLRKREAESLLQQDLLQSVFNAVYATDLQLKITSWNRAAEELYGWRQEEVIGQPIAAIMQPEYVQATAEEVLEQLFTKGYWQGEARLRNKAGHMLAVLAAARLLRDRHGEIIGVVGVSHDISEFIATQHALRESEGRLKRAETLAKIGHCAFSIDLKEVVLSDGLKEIWGYTVDENPEVDELLSRLHPEDRFAVAAMQEAAAEKRGFDVEYRLLLPDKSIRHLHSVYEYVPGSETEMPRYFGTMLDITTRVQAMVLLESSQQQLNSQYQKLPVPTYTYQRQGDEFFLIDFNEAAIKVTSGAIEQFRGKTLAETIFGRQDLIANVQTCYREQSTLRAEIDYMYPSSGEVHILRTTYVYAPPDLVMIFVEEITDQRRAEASLLLSEERLKQAVRVGNIGIFDHDHATGHLFWSPEMRRFYGWGEDEDIGIETLIAQTHAEDRELIHELAGKAHDPAGNGLFDTDHRIVNRAGEVRWISTRSETLFEGQGDARHPVRTIGAIVDVTESRRVADELRIKEAAIESAINGIVIADHQGDILYVNPSFRRIWGYEQDRDVVGQSINAHWCYGSAAGPAQESMLAAGSWIGDVVGIRPDGSRFDAQLSSSIVFDQAGQPQYQMYAILDLTRRKRDEKFLRTLNKAALAMQRALEPAAVFTAVADELSNIGLNCGIFTLTEDGEHLQVQHLSHNQAAVSRALKLTSLNLSSLK
ncbi:MAG: PAS domain S-box protein, partial [Anaerolineales bacterium]|nr:PAS domain S-box protein [Anaerolineales bacterium]